MNTLLAYSEKVLTASVGRKCTTTAPSSIKQSYIVGGSESGNSKHWRRSDFVFGRYNSPKSERDGGYCCISWAKTLSNLPHDFA